MNENYDWTQREAPTHVENRDVVWMGMTFVQIIMFILVSAVSYVIYQQPFIQGLPSYWAYAPPVAVWAIGVVFIMAKVGERSIVFVLLDVGQYLSSSKDSGRIEIEDHLDAAPLRDESEDETGNMMPHERVLAFVTRMFGG